jgi:hypothetical protein
VFQGAEDVVQAAAALRKHTAEPARSAYKASNGLACSEDAVLVKEHQDMLKRYRIQLYSTAVEHHGEQACIDDQVCTSGSLDSFLCISVAHVLYAVCEVDRFV